jgi:cell division protein ZipA
MSIVQWLILILVIVIVGGVYWYLRGTADSDPWRDMEEPEDRSDDDNTPVRRGESLGGDSYVVGVRTLSRDTPATRKAAARGESPQAEEQADEAVKKPCRAAPQPAPDETPPTNQAAGAPASAETTPSGAGQRVEMRARRPPAVEQDIFILHVASADGRYFAGPDIHATLAAADLKFGLDDFYHRITEAFGVAESVFAVANMLKPGTLDPAEQDHLRTPGLTLFLVLPGPLEGTRAMRDMMDTADALARELGGEVLDDKRALLKTQTAQYMHDQVAEFDRRVQLASRR